MIKFYRPRSDCGALPDGTVGLHCTGSIQIPAALAELLGGPGTVVAVGYDDERRVLVLTPGGPGLKLQSRSAAGKGACRLDIGRPLKFFGLRPRRQRCPARWVQRSLEIQLDQVKTEAKAEPRPADEPPVKRTCENCRHWAKPPGKGRHLMRCTSPGPKMGLVVGAADTCERWEKRKD